MAAMARCAGNTVAISFPGFAGVSHGFHMPCQHAPENVGESEQGTHHDDENKISRGVIIDL